MWKYFIGRKTKQFDWWRVIGIVAESSPWFFIQGIFIESNCRGLGRGLPSCNQIVSIVNLRHWSENCKSYIVFYLNFQFQLSLFISQDILYDRAKRSGRLYEKVRYKQRKRQDKEKNVASVVPNSISENNDQTIDELIAFFDSCVLSRDKSKLLEKMESSAEMRLASNGNNREMFDKCFHLYRLDSDLVSFVSNLNGKKKKTSF